MPSDPLTWTLTASTLRSLFAPGSGGADPWPVIVSVVADGSTDASSTIQTVLDGLASTASRSYEVVVEPAYPRTTGALIYLNNKVRITTSNTKVRFKAPVLLGTGCDPDGFGCLSVLGTQTGTRTVTTASAVRGNTVITVPTTTGLATRQMVRIYDDTATNGASAGYRSENAVIIDISGTSITLDHPLHHTYAGTTSIDYFVAIDNSGFEDVNATFTGQQAASFLFPAKITYGRNCFMRNCHFRGDSSNSWSRECFNVRWSYRCEYANCSATFSWDNAVGSTFSYGFTSDMATGITYHKCVANSLRHGFSSDKGSAGNSYVQCVADTVLASGFDLHGSWVRDITYTNCVATSAPDGKQANDNTHAGFLAGNTTFTAGAQFITYNGCIARGFMPYTSAAAGSASATGFGIVDGCSGIVYQGCRVYDSHQGIFVNSQIGVPITNVGIYNCEFHNISSTDAAARPAYPIVVTAGTAPNDVNGLVIDGCRIINSASCNSVRITGNSGNTLADITISNNQWITSQGISGFPSVDCRFIDRLVIIGNIFASTRRGVGLSTCVGAIVTDNRFLNLTEPGNCIRDSGGNTGFVFAQNFIYPAPTAHTVAPTSTGAFIDITGPTNTPTASRPTLTASAAGPMIYNPTTNKIEVWNGTAWVGTSALA